MISVHPAADTNYPLTRSMLGKFSADIILKYFFPENRIEHFMQIVILGDSLHKMSNLIFWEI